MTCSACPGADTVDANSALGLRVLGKMMQQQKLEGRAALQLIASADIAPPQQAPEAGKGAQVDVTA
ncbi:MAG: hypothetical protein ABL997_17110 [Planctomycetota bacterium]